MISTKTITEMVVKIAQGIEPQQIYLFGSYAAGNANEDSDIDLLIVKDSDLPSYQRSIEVQRLLIGSKLPFDIKVYTQEEFKTEQLNQFSFVYKAVKEAKLMYESK
jgi:uncharacterized protein